MDFPSIGSVMINIPAANWANSFFFHGDQAAGMFCWADMVRDFGPVVFGYIDPGTGLTVTAAGGALIAFLSGFLGVALLFFKRIFNFFKKHRRWVLVILLLMAAGAAGIIFSQAMTKQSTFEHKVVILGLDGLSPRIVESLMAEGRLPHLARLKEQGSYRHLATTNPPQSPVAWSAFSTGQNPGKNGIYDFIVRDPSNYRLSLSMSDIESGAPKPVIRSPRFWQIASKKKVPLVILECPVSFPPDNITGKMLSGMGVPDLLGTEGTFSFYTSRKEEKKETTGGQVIAVTKSALMVSHLVGPKVASGGKTENARVPFKVEVNGPSCKISFQGQETVLKAGEWSGWQNVSFKAGLFRTIKGIFKFYLVSVEPDFQLYVSPINLDPRDPFFPISYPADYAKQLSDELGLYATQGMPYDTWALNEGRLDEKAFIEQAEMVLSEDERIVEKELSRFDRGVFFSYFESPDIIQHMFWRYMDPRHPMYEPQAPARYKELIPEWYERMDRIVGRVMDALDSDDVLIVISDHGFDTFRRSVNLNTWLRDNGYLELKDPAAMSGQPLLKDVDWSKTKAYAAGFGAVYINERGREAQGIVNPGEEKERLKKEIAEKLEQLTDAPSADRVIHKVYRQEEVFWGPHQPQMPDLLIGYNTGYRASWQTALGDTPKNVIEDNTRKWSGDHLFDAALVDGILFTSRPAQKDNPHIMDIAPTVLKLVGFSDEELKALDLDGQPLF